MITIYPLMTTLAIGLINPLPLATVPNQGVENESLQGDTADESEAEVSQPSEATLDYLMAIETAQSNWISIVSSIRVDKEDGLFGDVISRFGTLSYVSGDSENNERPYSQVAFQLDRRLANETLSQIDERIVFDGTTLMHLDSTEQSAYLQHFNPPAEGRDHLRDGTLGSIALPIPLQSERLLQLYHVELSILDTETNTGVLIMSPLKQYEEQLIGMQLTLNGAFMPTELQFQNNTNANAETSEEINGLTLYFSRHEINTEIAADVFSTVPPEDFTITE